VLILSRQNHDFQHKNVVALHSVLVGLMVMEADCAVLKIRLK